MNKDIANKILEGLSKKSLEICLNKAETCLVLKEKNTGNILKIYNFTEFREKEEAIIDSLMALSSCKDSEVI